MPKINQEEYEILKGLDDKWKWIARNYNGALIIYTSKPMKNPNLYWDSFGERMDDRLFQFIQWEDESPYNIQELIEEYLYDNRPKLFIDGQEQSFEFIEESEGTEVKKNIEWLKSAIQQNLDFYNDNDEEWQMAKVRAYAKSLDLINQLDEPEVLPQELPVIPKYMAERIEKSKENNLELGEAFSHALNALDLVTNPTKELFWIKNNQELFARAWLDGYEIEQEPKYYAKIKGHENIGSNDKYWNYNTDMEELSIGDSEVHPNVISEYTIKATKEEWANLGITDDNADFVLVEELEE